MLHTKFQGHQPWHGSMTFVPPSQGGPIWNLASISPVVSEEKMFENVDIRHTYGRQRPTYPISSTLSLRQNILFQMHLLKVLCLYFQISHVMTKPVFAKCEQQRRRSACAETARMLAHPRSLISAFVVHCLASIIPILAISKVSRL